ncbi:Ca2+ regulator and membrane fusion protein Fig1-domain-containing protein [Elsinoe ampelina]|uniref:Ca2+ regulator and membrane fusion protein Fig1-domain-containing protein n=1 Tax=Elsinoe ampelina TaxID=302913 RepID=A0A6A6G1J1_9PEZI|nr:Ca2+ regulator and membrane fusion protein Fig1-domain-containing protein [Elsinoe ampelina]
MTSSSSSSSASSVKFAVRIQRFLPFLGFHQLLMILIAIAIVLLSLLLAGCSSSSPLIPDIFLIDFFYESYTPEYDPTQVNPGVTAAIANIVGDAMLEVRVGYFGLCITPDGSSFLCSNNATLLAEQISIDQDPLNLIFIANTFKNDVVFPYLIIVAIIFAFLVFLVLATFPTWREERDMNGSTVDVKPFPNRFAAQIALALAFIAAVFVLVSVLWQHTASVAAAQVAQDFGNGSVKSGVGTAAMVLGWFGFALLILVTTALVVIVISISVLDRLTDGSSSGSSD